MVESILKSEEFEDVVKAFTVDQKMSFDKLKSKLPAEQMKKAEERIPEMVTLKGKLEDLFD